MTEPQVLHSEATLKIAAAKNLCIAVWSNAPTLAQFDKLDALVQELRTKFPDGTGFLNVISGGVPKFSEEVRQRAAELTRKTTEKDLGTAHVVLVGGIAGAATRAFLSTILLISKSKQVSKVFGNFEGAAEWLAPRLNAGGVTWTAQEIVQMARDLTPNP